MSITALGLRAAVTDHSTQARTVVSPTRDVMKFVTAQAPEELVPAPPPPPQQRAQELTSFLSELTTFIPGDILTLYLAIQAALKSAFGPFADPPSLLPAQPGATLDFWACLIFTIIWIPLLRVVAAKASNTKYVFPYWPTFAGAIAFAIYAFSVDVIWLNPLTATRQQAAFVAIGVILSSTVLTLVNRVFRVAIPDQAV